MYTAFKLDNANRGPWAVPFLFKQHIADHITLVFGKHDPQFEGVECEAYAVVNTDHMQYLLCKVNGEKVRADGVPYHITWSIDDTCKPKDTGLHAKENFTKIQALLNNSKVDCDFQVLEYYKELSGSVFFIGHSSKKKDSKKTAPATTTMTATQYDVIFRSSLPALIEVVNSFLQEGWECQGQAVYVEQKGFFMQTMLKK